MLLSFYVIAGYFLVSAMTVFMVSIPYIPPDKYIGVIGGSLYERFLIIRSNKNPSSIREGFFTLVLTKGIKPSRRANGGKFSN